MKGDVSQASSEARLQNQDQGACDLQVSSRLQTIDILQQSQQQIGQKHHQRQEPRRLEGHEREPKEPHQEGTLRSIPL